MKTFVSRRWVRVGLTNSSTDFPSYLPDDRVYVFPREFVPDVRGERICIQLLEDNSPLFGDDEEFGLLGEARSSRIAFGIRTRPEGQPTRSLSSISTNAISVLEDWHD